MKFRLDHYILDENKNPVIEPDLLTWARWMEKTGNRRVAEDQVGEVWISTVFLGLDHNYGGKGPPVLWETMTFRGDRFKKKQIKIMGKKFSTWKGEWEEQNRCSGSWEQAEAMHADMVERVKAVELLKAPNNKQKGTK